MPLGALDCWVFLSCLEVLQKIESCCDRAQIDSNIANTVGLWGYATEKVPLLLGVGGVWDPWDPLQERENRRAPQEASSP